MSEQTFTSAEYFAGLAEKKIIGSKCKECGAVFLPPRAICAECLSEKMEEILLKGEGELAAYSVVYVPTTAMIEAGHNKENPNVAGIVKMVEGPTISAQILGLDVTKPAEIKIGTPLKAVFVERSGKTILAFEV